MNKLSSEVQRQLDLGNDLADKIIQAEQVRVSNRKKLLETELYYIDGVVTDNHLIIVAKNIPSLAYAQAIKFRLESIGYLEIKSMVIRNSATHEEC